MTKIVEAKSMTWKTNNSVNYMYYIEPLIISHQRPKHIVYNGTVDVNAVLKRILMQLFSSQEKLYHVAVMLHKLHIITTILTWKTKDLANSLSLHQHHHVFCKTKITYAVSCNGIANVTAVTHVLPVPMIYEMVMHIPVAATAHNHFVNKTSWIKPLSPLMDFPCDVSNITIPITLMFNSKTM